MNSVYRKEVIEFKKQKLVGEISLAQQPKVIGLTLIVSLLILVLLMFLSFGKYSKKVKVVGVTLPESGVVKLKANRAGIVSAINVEEGSFVQKNQAILAVDGEKFGADFELQESTGQFINSQIELLNSQLKSEKAKHDSLTFDIGERVKIIQQKIVNIEQEKLIALDRLKINQNILKQISSLSEKGYISELEITRQKDVILVLEQNLAQVASKKMDLLEQKQKLESLSRTIPIDFDKQATLIFGQVNELKSKLNSIELERSSEFRSPIEGRISSILIKEGSNVESGQPLLSIIPKDSKMNAVVFVPNTSFNSIQKGARVKIRYSSFPYQRFGFYEGTVSEVSQTPIYPNETSIPNIISEPSYKAVISISDQFINTPKGKVSLKAGLNLEADIVIESRSLFGWLLDPLYKLQKDLS